MHAIVALVLMQVAQAGGEMPPPTPALKWRNVGPFRGGWSTCVEGIPAQPDVFYFGAAGGGVWRTDDAGRTWKSVFDGDRAAAIGALAIAPSNPDIVYVGTGQVDLRYDVASGRGLYRSDDGGHSWRHLGLTETRAIGRILVDPSNPNVVLVAALGHVFGPNPERGVYRTEDGGKTWKRTLFVDSGTGAVDLASDPTHPATVYAAAWQAQNHPWLSYFQPETGPRSGVYKSEDGGRSWRRLGGQGWPEGPLGRIGLAVSGQRVYALVDAELPAETGAKRHHPAQESASGLYRSDNAGSIWARVSKSDWMESSYAERITVDPANPNRLYAMGQSIRISDDGGKSFDVFKGAPGGDDYHFLWVNPERPDHMAAASDQGTIVSVNGGGTWSSWYNQPTGQFYHLAVDNRFPYWIYSGQQDSGSVAIASRSDFGSIGWRDWHPVGADERDDDIPDPSDPEIVYGSGLGGSVRRFDTRTGQSTLVSPQVESTYAKRPTTEKYRYGWVTPMAVSPRAPFPLYLGAQALFRSLDKGGRWEVISPDLSRKIAGTTHCDGEPTLESALACGFGVISALALSPSRDGEIWVGTDDGKVSVTRNAGRDWVNVTPPTLGPWSKVSSLEVSARQPDAIYIAVDRHRLDDFSPHVLRTKDGGKSWAPIVHGLPTDGFVSVVRADPARPGLLYAGTETGTFVSFSDGDQWLPLTAGLPTVTVTDLLVTRDDVVAATQGRALWVLDDVSALRQWNERLPAGTPRLFEPAHAVRLRQSEGHDTPFPKETPSGPNPPAGGVIDYWVPSGLEGPVRLTIVDAHGETVREFTSGQHPAHVEADRYFESGWEPEAEPLSAAPGHHRFVWDLRYPRPRATHYEYSISAVWGRAAPADPGGVLAAPGTYEVRLAVGGELLQQPITLESDPRLRLAPDDLAKQVDAARRVSRLMDRSFDVLQDVRAFHKAHPTDNRVDKLEHGEKGLVRLNERLSAVLQVLQSADAAPTATALAEVAAAEKDLSESLAVWAAVQRR